MYRSVKGNDFRCSIQSSHPGFGSANLGEMWPCLSNHHLRPSHKGRACSKIHITLYPPTGCSFVSVVDLPGDMNTGKWKDTHQILMKRPGSCKPRWRCFYYIFQNKERLEGYVRLSKGCFVDVVPWSLCYFTYLEDSHSHQKCLSEKIKKAISVLKSNQKCQLLKSVLSFSCFDYILQDVQPG